MAAEDASRMTRAARRRLGLAGEEEGSFLARWSRRKDAARAGALADDGVADPGDLPAHEADAARAGARGEGSSAEAAEPEIRPEDLPDPDTLTAQSDFSVFMQKGVPPDLQQRALRKLWLTDPTLANLDGLLDYGGDFSQVGKAKMAIKTAWQVGKGYLAALDAGETAKAAAGEGGADAGPDREAVAAADGVTESPQTHGAPESPAEDAAEVDGRDASDDTRPPSARA
ncbi:DUF3306 domain-containing protein [Futiania mangrovi]|uniref:DUF3306 domain-containing protein n=1 Tax=Futiania mangrovi TaxID=2959716 RepID=A0A9J6PCN8_9PROT|nr:DUF3306 domain-containing protein [Futiania mangrovii]MCP1335411.1 DUF3306 domain-containing protein [Futiania mangrovii]